MSLRGFFVDLVLGAVRLLPGSGSPESAVTAPVGSLYLRDDGGAATTLYVKESGAGDTGWTPVGAGGSGITELTGDVTAGPGSAAQAATIADGAVTNAKSADMAESTLKGRAVGAGTGAPTDLSAAQATAVLDAVVGDSGSGGTKGLVPAPAAGDAAAEKYLKANGVWTSPAGAGDVVGPASSVDERIAVFNGTTGKLLEDGGGTIVDVIAAAVAAAASAILPVDLASEVTGTLPLAAIAQSGEHDAGTSGTSKTIDWNDGQQQIVELTGNATFTLNNGVNGEGYRLIAIQDATGGRTMTFPADVEWEGGSPPTFDTTLSTITVIALIKTSAGTGGYLGFATTSPIGLP